MNLSLTTSDYDYCVFDELGKPMTFKDWLAYSSEPRFKRESVVNGFTLITSYVGVDMPHPDKWTSNFKFARWKPNAIPLIFEIIVYDQDSLPVYLGREATRDEAYTKHSLLIKEFSKE
jgi:hypothetical protein